jgi:uncharacterized surface protein with fasciclin (FAS1) repeats
MRKNILFAGVAMLGLGLGLQACAPAMSTKMADGKMADGKMADDKMACNKNTIVDLAVATPRFSTLVKAVTAAGLAETLSGPGPFTVFAPNDAAFAKIPKADLDAILADKAKLTAILKYHVVAGKVLAADVVTLKSATTLNGDVTITVAGKSVKVNDANVVATDIVGCNGVIHEIDSVLLPK